MALLPALLTALMTACSDAGEAGDWLARDSAGVEIIENASPTEASPSVWRLDPEPLLEIGAVDAAGPTQFYRILDVAVLPDGGLAVTNTGSDELRIFHADGTPRAVVGGHGHGPEEFDGLARLWLLGDSLLTYDGGNQRLSVRRLDGSLVRTFQLDWFDGILFPVDVLSAASPAGEPAILAVTARYMSQLRGTGLVIDTALVSLYDMDGTLIDSIARVPHNARVVQRVGNRQTTLGAPYIAGASLVGYGGELCSTFGPKSDIRCRDRDGIRRIIRVDLPNRPVTDAHIAAYWDEAMETANDRARDALRRMHDVMPFPAEFPAFSQLLIDDDGRLWARRYRTPDNDAEAWLIFDGGRWVARLETPVGYRVMDVQDGRVAGVWQDSLGVEFVRVYRIRER